VKEQDPLAVLACIFSSNGVVVRSERVSERTKGLFPGCDVNSSRDDLYTSINMTTIQVTPLFGSCQVDGNLVALLLWDSRPRLF
jgi:hypothetical protein